MGKIKRIKAFGVKKFGQGIRSIVWAIKTVYELVIVAKEKEIHFLVLASFLVTFALARLVVYLAPGFGLHLSTTHVHHFAYGIIFLSVAGYLALVARSKKLRAYVAILYSIGLALAFDEFAIWLRLNDNYWVRGSYDAGLIILAILINIVYFREFWSMLAKRLWAIIFRRKYRK